MSTSTPAEKPVVWFSSNTQMEPTALKMVRIEGTKRSLTIEQQHFLIGVVRFAVAFEPPVLHQVVLRQVAHINRATWNRMVYPLRVTGGNPEHWYGVVGAVDRSLWLGIEVWTPEGGWRSMEPTDWERMDELPGVTERVA